MKTHQQRYHVGITVPLFVWNLVAIHTIYCIHQFQSLVPGFLPQLVPVQRFMILHFLPIAVFVSLEITCVYYLCHSQHVSDLIMLRAVGSTFALSLT